MTSASRLRGESPSPPPNVGLAAVETPTLSQGDYQRLTQFIETHVGIRLAPAKRTMLEARLMRRLREHRLTDFRDYVDLFFSPESHHAELEHVVDLATTHHTFFFREGAHFEALSNTLLPELLRRERALRVWSAGCSTGEEAYSLAMVLAEAARTQKFEFSVMGTDVSSRVLSFAQRAVYGEEVLESIPAQLRTRYVMRSKNKERRQVRIVPELRKRVAFRPLNLTTSYQLEAPVHILFLRNVLIYFEPDQARELLLRALGFVVPQGFLVISHTESIEGLSLPVARVGRSIFRRLA